MSSWKLVESSAPINVDGCPAGSGALIPVALEGPPGPPGPQGPAGPIGPPGTAYEHTQAIAATVWTVNHNLGFRPDVAVFTTGGLEVEAEVLHMSTNQTQITLLTAMTGFARFS